VEIKIAKFHQPVILCGVNLSSVNLANMTFGHRNRYTMGFDKGLLTIVDTEAKDETSNVALVGLANICYMITGGDKKKVGSKKGE